MKPFKTNSWEKINKRYNIVIYSSDANKLTKNYHISKIRVISYFILVFIFSTAAIGSILFFSPINGLITKRGPELERINALGQKVKNIYLEMINLQEYNNRLRYALGDTSVQKLGIDFSKPIESNVLSAKIGGSPTIANVSLNGIENNSFRFENDDNTLNIPFATPVANFVLSQEFDEESSHFGIDFAGKTGEPIIAAADGYVIFSNWTHDFGNTIFLMHGSKFITVYKHNSSNLKSTGSYVRRGEIIALLGNTGKFSTSPHLHFEIWKNGVAKNPLKYLLIK